MRRVEREREAERGGEVAASEVGRSGVTTLKVFFTVDGLHLCGVSATGQSEAETE